MPATGAPTASVQPGDIFVVVPGSYIFGWISRGESIIDRNLIKQQKALGKPVWGHAGVCAGIVGQGSFQPPPLRDGQDWAPGTVFIVQAEPGGAQLVPWAWENRQFLWSTNILPPCPQAATAALGYAGYLPAAIGGGWAKEQPAVGYSFLDYLAIETHALGIPAPGLQGYIETTKHQICSQLADNSRLAGGSHLFSDGRWPGYVTPLDIGLRLEGVQ